MSGNRNITLSREEWEAFERRLNTPDPERARRAEAFLHQFDQLISVQREENRTIIDIPWIEDSHMLELLGVQAEKPKRIVTEMQSEDFWNLPVGMQRPSLNAELIASEITGEGKFREYCFSEEDSYTSVLRAGREREYANRFGDAALLQCA